MSKSSNINPHKLMLKLKHGGQKKNVACLISVKKKVVFSIFNILCLMFSISLCVLYCRCMYFSFFFCYENLTFAFACIKSYSCYVRRPGLPDAGTAAGVSDSRSWATLMGSDKVWNTIRRSRSRRGGHCQCSLTRSNQVCDVPSY